MIINLKTKLRTSNFEDMKEPIVKEDGTKEQVDVKISNLFMLALRNGYNEQKGDKEGTKAKDYEIEVKIILAKDGEVDLEPEEIVRLKNLSERIFDSFIYGQLSTILGGKEIPF